MRAIIIILLLLSMAMATPALLPLEQKPDWCHGCWYGDDQCVPPGTRLCLKFADVYCTEDELLLGQKTAESSCENNYECKSNECAEGKCAGIWLIEAIFDLLKGVLAIIGV